jgi:hypothetical protein
MLNLPEFPKNTLGIERGTYVRCADIEVQKQLGIKVGQSIPVGFDGEYVRFGPFTWSIDQLVGEIEGGYWEINGKVDLSDEKVSRKFAKEVERLNID